jgi:uncharacterized membrane protein
VDALGKVLLATGLVLLAAGVAFLLVSRFGLHKLPGDIVIRRRHVTIYVPLGLMIVLSLLLTVLLNVFSHR